MLIVRLFNIGRYAGNLDCETTAGFDFDDFTGTWGRIKNFAGCIGVIFWGLGGDLLC